MGGEVSFYINFLQYIHNTTIFIHQIIVCIIHFVIKVYKSNKSKKAIKRPYIHENFFLIHLFDAENFFAVIMIIILVSFILGTRELSIGSLKIIFDAGSSMKFQFYCSKLIFSDVKKVSHARKKKLKKK